MERLALVGVSQRRGGMQALEAWTAWVQQLSAWPAEWGSEIVPLLTCNRCDLILALPEGLELAELRQHLQAQASFRGYAYSDEAALEQLCRIAASLDSLNPGEDQIMNQVRLAFEEAKPKGTVGPVTGFAFQTALRIAKRVRREIPLAPINTSLFSLAKPELETLTPGSTLAVVGAGAMGTLAAQGLVNSGFSLLVVNRSLENARKLAQTVGGSALSLEQFLADPPRLEALVCATPVEHLIGPDFLKTQAKLQIIIDLGLPRNVNPVVGQYLKLLDQDYLLRLGEQRRIMLRDRLAQAEQLIAEELEEALGEWAERSLGGAITHLRKQYRATLEQAVGELLDPTTISRLANRFAHFPIKGLRGLARRQGLEAAQVFLEEAELVGEK